MPQLVFLHGPARAPALTRSTIKSGISEQRRADLARPPRGQPVSGRHAIHGMGARLAVGAGPERDLVLIGYTLGASIALHTASTIRTR